MCTYHLHMLLHGDLPWTSPIGDGFFLAFLDYLVCVLIICICYCTVIYPGPHLLGMVFLAFLDYLVCVLIICICYCTVIYPGPHLLGMGFFSLFGLFSMCTYHLHMLLHGDLPWTSPIGDGVLYYEWKRYTFAKLQL